MFVLLRGLLPACEGLYGALCLAIALLKSFAWVATNFVTCSEVYKDLKNWLWTQAGHLLMHKKHVLKAVAMAWSFLEAHLPEP